MIKKLELTEPQIRSIHERGYTFVHQGNYLIKFTKEDLKSLLPGNKEKEEPGPEIARFKRKYQKRSA